MEGAGAFRADLGMWVELRSEVAAGVRPALFVDRDGVLVEEPGYLNRVEDVVMIPGAAEVVALANRRGIPVVEVTNQAGIGRGYYGWREFLNVEEVVADALARSGAAIDAVFACPYHRDGVDPWVHPDHPARKPNPGMFTAAAELLRLDLGRSWIVGDNLNDLKAGYNAGLRHGVLVLTGHGAEFREAVREWAPAEFGLRVVESIREAAGVVELLGA